MTRLASRVSMSLTSWGLALSIMLPHGVPLPSVSNMILVPLPRLVLPTQRPLFSRMKTFHRQSTLLGRSCLGDQAYSPIEPTLF